MKDLTTLSSTVWSTVESATYRSLDLEDTYVEQFYNPEPHQHPLGPKRDALYIVIPISVIYLLIFLSGVVGNVSTCVVIARNKSMHTATNYYLFSLAISDLLLLISGLPAEVYLVWSKYPYIFGEVFCVLRGLAAETSTNASVLTITAFTIERYVAICHPFLSQTMSKLPRVVKLNLSIWLVSLSCALPQALQFGIVQYAAGPDNVVCALKRVIVQHSFELSTLLFFVVPMTLITILYALIALKLRKSNMMKRNRPRNTGFREKPGTNRRNGHCRQNAGKSSRRVLKMLVAVVVAFFICWAPFHVQRLIAIYGHSTTNRTTPAMDFLYHLFTYTSGVLYYVSTTINPILYNIMSHKFREAFMDTFAKNCRISGIVGRREHCSHSSLSRSQQRINGTFGSRTTGVTAGNGAAQESTGCSGNSGRDESIRGAVSTSGKDESDIASYDSAKGVHKNDMGNTQGENSNPNDCHASNPLLSESHVVLDIRNRNNINGLKCEILTLYTATAKPNGRSAVKKWWRLLDWLPGLKSLKIARGLTRDAEENTVLENIRRDEYSIPLCTFNEHHRPI